VNVGIAIGLGAAWLVWFGAVHAVAPAGEGGTAKEGRIEVIASDLEYPWSLAFLADRSVLVTERAGRLRRIREGRLSEEPVAGVPEVLARGQGGLLEVLPHPDFRRNRLLFLSFAKGEIGANATAVARARYEDGRLEDLRIIFEAKPTKRGPAHFGGRMAFLPDGTLLLGLGDGFDLREEAQNLNSHLGKIVRITIDGEAPKDNPFFGREDALPEIYSYGHRNVQGLIVDGLAVYAHEHGPRGGDELNRIEPGQNYGWPLATSGVDYSGALISPYRRYPGTVAPLVEWTPSIAPAGLMRYRGDMFPEWKGDFFIAALAGRGLWRVRLDPFDRLIEQEKMLADLGERIREVREAPDGSIWITTDSPRGRVLRLYR
jgi:glucose/arabinose dehydrogenase